MVLYKGVNGVKVEMTAEEEAALRAEWKKWDDENPALDRALAQFRLTRNSLLEKTDWWGASDNTMTDAQKEYRQKLRDATNGLDTVEKIRAYEFPEEVLK